MIAGAYLIALFTVRRVPDPVLGLVGGPTGLARDGGLVARYRPPTGQDHAVQAWLGKRGRIDVRQIGPAFAIEVMGIGEAEASSFADILRQGGLEFREEIEDISLLDVAVERQHGEDVVAPGVSREADAWFEETSGQRHTSWYLRAQRREDLEQTFARLRATRWSPPRGSVIAYERVTTDGGSHWRSHMLRDQVALDGGAVAAAIASHDPNTGRPVVMIDFTDDGAVRFAALTERITGQKLATLIGGRVLNAPIIMGRIDGGKATVTMGGGAILQQERDAAALAAVLEIGPVPFGGEVEDARWVAPTTAPGAMWLARLAIALCGGAFVGGAFWLVARVARPSWQPGPTRRPGHVPLRRWLVTLLAPLSLVVLSEIPLALNYVELDHMVVRSGLGPLASQVFKWSIAVLGVRPILWAFVLVEAILLLVKRWRPRRLDPAFRIATGRVVAVVGTVFAIAQSIYIWMLLRDLQQNVRASIEFIPSGLAAQLVLIITPVCCTLLLVAVAGIIRQHGLGNGYGALIVSEWLIEILHRTPFDVTASPWLGVCAFAAIAITTGALLRMRITATGEAALRVPSAGALPLLFVDVAFVCGLVAGAIGAGAAHDRWTASLRAMPLVALPLVIARGWIWSYAMARPAVAASIAQRAGLAPPSVTTWRRATLFSLVSVVAIAGVWQAAIHTDLTAGVLGDALYAMLFAAVLLDIADEARVRRADMVAIWPLHQANHAEIVQRVLTDAGIPCFLHARHLRTLLGPFAAFAPIDVLVPASDADTARARIAALYADAAPATVAVG